jgi:ketosteroid isomerase-like protein
MRSIFAAVLMICALGQAHAASDADRSAIRGIIQDQIEAFRQDDAARAFSYATPSLQGMFGSQERFMAMVKDAYKPVYRPRSIAMGEFRDTPDGGMSLSVRLQDLDGADWVALYTLEQQADGTWRISACYLTKEPGQAV